MAILWATFKIRSALRYMGVGSSQEEIIAVCTTAINQIRDHAGVDVKQVELS